MFENSKAITSINFGNNFDTTTVTNMNSMFKDFGSNALTRLDLNAGEMDFDTTNVTDMRNMFNGCGSTAMTELDLGPAFIRIANNNSDFVKNCGKSGANVIQVAQLIYNDTKHFKLNKDITRVDASSATTSNYIAYERGTINPKYSPFWAKEDSYTVIIKENKIAYSGISK
jgi:surface protein